MKNMLNGIDDILLMGPGPSYVPPEVYDAMSKKTLGHLDPYFFEIMDEIKKLLQYLFKTNNNLTIPVSGTGSAGMETCFVNLIEKGDPVLILINGVFGVRMQDVATRLGADVDALEFAWGTPVIPEKVKEKIAEKSYKIVAIVHAETSTGVKNPVKEVGDLLKGSDTLFLVDTVTSLGGIEVSMDDWGIDAIYSGTQKCLSCPPGLAPVSFSDRAVNVIMGRKNKVPNWYLDMSMVANYWAGKKRTYHHTAPINMLYALYQALLLIMEEGMENVWKRHQSAHIKLVSGLESLGLKMVVQPEYRLPMLNAVYLPEGVDDEDCRKRLRYDHNIEIGGGLGDFAGKVWRIGLMGHTARERYAERLINALKDIIR